MSPALSSTYEWLDFVYRRINYGCIPIILGFFTIMSFSNTQIFPSIKNKMPIILSAWPIILVFGVEG